MARIYHGHRKTSLFPNEDTVKQLIKKYWLWRLEQHIKPHYRTVKLKHD